MRPLRLTMSAFGPYAGRESIDFTPALEAGIFGIYGPTGAGKSSIFAAISFALFGQLPNTSQEITTIRSDHAETGLMTNVDLVFEVGTKRYLIKRRPWQMRPAKRGGGETAEHAHAAFFDVTGITLDDIDQGATGTVIQERKTGEVDKEIKALLGYGPAQFRQIILLPQGEFETFLRANTKDRMEVLRQLFDVSIYRRFAETLKDKANTAEKNIKAGRAAVAARLIQEKYESREALADAVTVEHDKAAVATDASTRAQETGQTALADLTAARATESVFVEQDTSHRDLAALLARKGDIDEMRDKQHLLDRVAKVLPLEDAVTNATAVATQTAQHSTACTHVVTRAKQTHATTVTVLKTLTETAETRGAWQADILRLNGYSDALIGATPLADAMRHAKDNHAKTASTLDAAERVHGTAQTAMETAQIALETARAKIETHQRLTEDLRDATEFATAAEAYIIAANHVTNCEARCQTASDDLGRAVAATAIADRAYSDAEMALSAVQAVHLATKLRDSTPCPVCGSCDHPSPADGNPESAGLNTAFETARDHRKAAHTVEKTAQSNAATAQATLDAASAHIATLVAPAAEHVDQRAAITAAIDALGPIPDLDDMRCRVDTATETLAEARTAHDTARNAETTACTQLTKSCADYNAVIKQLPDGMTTDAAITNARRITQNKVDKYDADLATARDAERVANDALIAASRDAEIAGQTEAEARTNLWQHQQILDAGLVDAELDRSQYDIARPDIGALTDLRRMITDYDTRCQVARTRVAQADGAVAGLSRPDIATFEHTYETTDIAARATLSAKSTQDARCAQLERLQATINADIAGFAREEAQIAPLLAVAQASNGNNAAKLTLETYAIAAMFDQVLVAANLRLRPMSGGQYTLCRDTRAPKGGAKQGLDIIVNDTHTGRARDVATLSGGETFMAALSLALGLADVVQSVSGGIHLDTIFIDEGFGSLDATTLDQALQTLQDLVGDSRAVGLISHVDLVKDTIRTGFDITKSATGSQIKVRG